MSGLLRTAPIPVQLPPLTQLLKVELTPQLKQSLSVEVHAAAMCPGLPQTKQPRRFIGKGWANAISLLLLLLSCLGDRREWVKECEAELLSGQARGAVERRRMEWMVRRQKQNECEDHSQ